MKNLPAMQETQVWSLGQEDPLEKGKATHSSIIARWSPWTRGVWRAVVHGVAKSQTWLSDLTLYLFLMDLLFIITECPSPFLVIIFMLKFNFPETSVAVQWLQVCFHVGLILGWGARISYASQPRNQNMRQKQCCGKFSKDFKNGLHKKYFFKSIFLFSVLFVWNFFPSFIFNLFI